MENRPPDRLRSKSRALALRIADVKGFIRRRKKALLIILLVVGSFLTFNVASAIAFSQTIENNGVRIETDKTVYQIGENVRIWIYLVNKLGFPIDTCVSNIVLLISGTLGKVYQTMSFYSCSSSELAPGSETRRDSDSWEAWVLPGTYTIEVSIYSILGLDESLLPFTGNASILVII